MTKSDKVRRLMAKAQITGMEDEKLIKQVMKSCEFTRGLAVTYIRKNKGTAALRETVKALKEKLGDKAPAKTEGKKVGRPRKTEAAPVVETPAAPVVDTPAVTGTVLGDAWPAPVAAVTETAEV